MSESYVTSGYRCRRCWWLRSTSESCIGRIRRARMTGPECRTPIRRMDSVRTNRNWWHFPQWPRARDHYQFVLDLCYRLRYPALLAVEGCFRQRHPFCLAAHQPPERNTLATTAYQNNQVKNCCSNEAINISFVYLNRCSTPQGERMILAWRSNDSLPLRQTRPER
jgi:hypothetical protein